MDLAKELHYKAYKHKYEIGQEVYIKPYDEQMELNNFFEKNDNMESLIESEMYLSEQMRIRLTGISLEVVNQISWHMGIPYYELKTKRYTDTIYLAEYYLLSLRVADDYKGKYLGTNKDMAHHKFFAYEVEDEIHIVYESGSVSIEKIQKIRDNMDKYLFTPYVMFV